jgi:F0F1-type ATP synthase membrane subunit c/vacuolar-type H+-ATPase subunit K
MPAARENWVRRLRQAAAVTAACLAGVLMAGCSAGSGQGSGQVQGHAVTSAAPSPPDPRTTSALLKIATVFNNDYDRGVYGPVYDRWDARSQAVITRAQYITRHRDCPSAPHAAALVESATPGPHGAWLVDYEIGGQRLTDYWFYVHRRWVFDLVLSNPGSVGLYRMTPRQYAAATGCAHG